MTRESVFTVVSGLLCALIVTTSAAADARTSAGMINGLMWQQMGDLEKTYYVLGLVETSTTEAETCPSRPVILDKCKCSVGDLVEGVTAFYKGAEPRWLRLPVLFAVSMDAQRRSGVPLEKLAEFYLRVLDGIDKLDPAKARQ